MTPPNTSPETYNSRKFRERHAFHVGAGLRGREVFRVLASDKSLPALLSVKDVAAITRLTPEALRSRRNRNQAPDWVRPHPRSIFYPIDSVCLWLAEAERPSLTPKI